MVYGFKSTHCPVSEMGESIPILQSINDANFADEKILCKSCTEDAAIMKIIMKIIDHYEDR